MNAANMANRLLITLLTGLCSLIGRCGTIPIIAYMGVPPTGTSEANFRIFAEAGFDVSLSGYPSLAELLRACRTANRHGVKILGHCPETHTHPESSAMQLRNEPGFFGYVLADEPTGPEIAPLQQEIRRLRFIDNRHCFYINLMPWWGDWILTRTLTSDYQSYVEAAAETDAEQISFDNYPVTNTGIRDDWYRNLELIRQVSISRRKPFWAFVLSTPHWIYPLPTLGTLRMQVFSNLAYGAQAIQYYTYWTPMPVGEHDYHDGPVDNLGNPTATYSLVRTVNSEIKALSPIFADATVESVTHTGDIPVGTTRMTHLPQGITSFSFSGNHGALVSVMRNGDNRYCVVVNKDPFSQATLYVSAAHGTRMLDKMLAEHDTPSSITIQAGDIAILKLE